MQRQLLIAEGIPVDGEGRLPLKRFLWTPDLEALALEINQFAIARE
jgi:methylated-DNA-protein-cysteine methyltransferase-like protein